MRDWTGTFAGTLNLRGNYLIVGQSLEEMLKLFGLTEKETEVYLYLAKQGVKKTSQIAKALKVNKGLTYRILKRLEQKQLVEITLESPSRYVVIPFEKLIDNYVESKREEAAFIEDKKQQLLLDWKKIGHPEPEFPLEKFSVIEEEKKVFHKICELVNKTKKEFVSIATVEGLLRAEKYGVLDCILNHPYKSKIKFRYIANVNAENFTSIKFLLGKLNSIFSLKGKQPDLQSNLFPRFVISDNEELLLFIHDYPQSGSTFSINAALCTNCKALIQPFYALFEEIWGNSSDIETRIDELESGKSKPNMELIKNPNHAEQMFLDSLNKAREEVFIVTSSERIIDLAKKVDIIQTWCNKGISTKIMAPITTQNLDSVAKLLECSEVRHMPVGYLELTIIDDKVLFQFNDDYSGEVEGNQDLNLENVLFTNNLDYIKKTKKNLFEIWKNTHMPTNSIRYITSNLFEESNPMLGSHVLEKATDFMQNMQFNLEHIDEEKVSEKIEKEKKNPCKNFVDWSSAIKYFGTRAFAVIPAIPSLLLPKMVIGVVHYNGDSSFGAENWLVVNLWQKTQRGFSFIPAVFVQDNPQNVSLRKKIFKGFPVENNIIPFKKGELEIQLNGRTLFAGWTKKIPLDDLGLSLPPATLIFEGYGKVKPGMFTNVVPSGRRQEVYYNSFDAFVTFFHCESKYAGSGIEGFIEREHVMISTECLK